MDVKATLHPCAHCATQGTCKTGEEGSSCAVCIKANELKGKGYIGLTCGVCGGLGQAEPITERINKRIQPVLAISILLILIIGVFISAATQNPYFSQLLAFAGPLIGAILGFYFTSRTAPKK